MPSKSKILDRGSFLGYGYTVREGESNFDGAERAVRRHYGKNAFLSTSHSPCQAGPWRVSVLTPSKGGGCDVHAGSWHHAEYFEVLTADSSNRPVEDEA